ncbi:MAG: biotin/lipoyl-binding protein, partial [Anaerolineales bacterium]
MKTTIKLLAFILIFTVFVSACSNFSAEATPTPRPAVDDDYIPVISATGKVVPAEWATLSVQAGGVVAEVLVEEGKMVEAGQVLLRLEGEEDAQAIIATAQLELATAQNALDDLLDQDYELLAAQARQQMDEAQKTL